MSRFTVSLFSALLVAVIALCAIPACATTWQATKVTSYAVDMFPAADFNNGYLASVSNQIRSINSDGSWSTTGLNGFNPTRVGAGLAYYNTSGLPIIGSNPIASSWIGSPSVAPCVSQNGQFVALAGGGDGRVLIAGNDGSVLKDTILMNPSLWTLASMSWAPDGKLYVVAQDRWDANMYGYHLFSVDSGLNNLVDMGKGYSEVSVSGNKVLLTSWDHHSLTAWNWTSDGLTFEQAITATGVSYWNVGRGYNGRFAALDNQNHLYSIQSVPEPSALLAFCSGLVGLLGVVRRRH